MAQKSPNIEKHAHGPANAEHEIKKAYNLAVECGVTYYWDRKDIPGVNPDEVLQIYKKAYDAHRDDNRLAAERWARTAKHLARAFWSEAKIAFLLPRTTQVPFLESAAEEYGLHESLETTEDLVNSLAHHAPPGMDQMPSDMTHYLSRARKHLQLLHEGQEKNELLRAERIKAAHEYGRVLECLGLAYEAVNQGKKGAA